MGRYSGLFIIYLIVALYIINLGFGFVKIPEAVSQINKWILAVAAVLIIIAGFRWLKSNYYNTI